RDVLRLRAGQRWFDGGAGDAFVGQVYRGLTPFRERLSSGIAALEIELHGSKIRRPEGKPTHPGNISLKKKLDQISITDRADYVGLTYGASAWVPRSSQNGRYRLFVGKYFSEVSNEDIGATDLITDLFGLIPYSVDPDTVLARYLTLSRREGVIYIADGGPRSQFLSESTVKKRDGRIVSFLDWMREIPGIRVQHRPQSEDTVLSTLLMREIRTVSSARITKIQAFTAKNNIRFPKLKMVGKLSDADRFETKEFIETMENHVVIPLEP
ncbi:MAG TPA: hypothetical protein PLH57_10715, partial [Oligoflexia bacterium]|nr:hypothetical protein [Oligoflexia bacterium]